MLLSGGGAISIGTWFLCVMRICAREIFLVFLVNLQFKDEDKNDKSIIIIIISIKS